MSKTAINGEINCLDPGGFGAVTINKSLTIDCHEVFGSILYSGTNGIVISFDLFNAQDTQKTVRLRNLNLNGVKTGLIGIRIIGGGTIVGGAVFIEDSLIDGNFGRSSAWHFRRAHGWRQIVRLQHDRAQHGPNRHPA